MSGPLPAHSIKESIGHDTRGTTIVEVFDLGCSGEEDYKLPLVEIIANLQSALASIPEQFRSAAFLNIRAYGEYASAYADVKFLRPETDAELADRRRWLKSLDDEREESDRRAYERLKAKYEQEQRDVDRIRSIGK